MQEDKLKHRTWFRVALLYSRTFRRMSEKLTPVGLSVAQFDLLACLVAAEPAVLKQSDLASRLLVTKGNISGMLGRMTDLGLVMRADDPHDRRSKRIKVTDQGRTLFQRGREVQNELIDEMFGELDGHKIALFEKVVEELCEKIHSERVTVETTKVSEV